jgi:hypothetical protein
MGHRGRAVDIWMNLVEQRFVVGDEVPAHDGYPLSCEILRAVGPAMRVPSRNAGRFTLSASANTVASGIGLLPAGSAPLPPEEPACPGCRFIKFHPAAMEPAREFFG